MRSLPQYAVLTLFALACGCAPIIVGSMMASHSSSQASRQRFLSELQRTNLEREARGLTPLDFCSQAYRFDRDWAMEDPRCAARIRRFEQGDSSALDPPGSVSPGTMPAVPDSIQRIYDQRDSVNLHHDDWMRGGK